MGLSQLHVTFVAFSFLIPRGNKLCLSYFPWSLGVPFAKTGDPFILLVFSAVRAAGFEGFCRELGQDWKQLRGLSSDW